MHVAGRGSYSHDVVLAAIMAQAFIVAVPVISGLITGRLAAACCDGSLQVLCTPVPSRYRRSELNTVALPPSSAAEAASSRRSSLCCTVWQCAFAAAGAGSWAPWRDGGSSNFSWSVDQRGGVARGLLAAMRDAAASLRTSLTTGAGCASIDLAGRVRSSACALQAPARAVFSRLTACNTGGLFAWRPKGSRLLPSGAGIRAAALRWLLAPWLLAALACLVLPPLLKRSSNARLLVSAAGSSPDRQSQLAILCPRCHSFALPHMNAASRA